MIDWLTHSTCRRFSATPTDLRLQSISSVQTLRFLPEVFGFILKLGLVTSRCEWRFMAAKKVRRLTFLICFPHFFEETIAALLDTKHVARISPPYFGMLDAVGSSLKMVRFLSKQNPTCRSTSQSKSTQHVAPNNVAICWVEILQLFGLGLTIDRLVWFPRCNDEKSTHHLFTGGSLSPQLAYRS